MNFQGKTVIVTGGGSGIGLAAALEFTSLNANVLITGRRGGKLDEIVAREPRMRAFVGDVSDPSVAERTVARAVQLWGRIDVLVNNAGAGEPLALSDVSIERIRAIYAVNVIAPRLLAAAALPFLAAHRGAIVNVSSTYARKAIAGFADYAASKAALEHLTRCWALELAPKGVRVNAVAAGPVKTPFLRERMGFSAAQAEAIEAEERAKIPLGRRGTPQDVARWIVALADAEASWVTGQVFPIDGGLSLA